MCFIISYHVVTMCYRFPFFFFQFFQPTQEELPPMGQWILAECPARIDVSGGWSDTPPITYEHGGAVTIVALFINGKVKWNFAHSIS